MIKSQELTNFIFQTIGKELLQKARKIDEMPNGVQFIGDEKVKKIALGVSLNEEFLQKAVEWGSNFCIFHHALDVRTYQSLYPLYAQKRLKLIYKNNMTIIGFHYALDAHPVIGNNATIIKKLGANLKDAFFDEWGYTGTFNKSQDIFDLAHQCQEITNHEVFVIAGGPKRVKTIAVVSGGAKPYAENIAEMEEKGVELFITGETTESAPHKMQETNINYFVCGHYATEVFGVQELGKMIASHFKSDIDVQFIDTPNPI